MKKKRTIIINMKPTGKKLPEEVKKNLSNILANSDFKDNANELILDMQMVALNETTLLYKPEDYQHPIDLANALLVLQGSNIQISNSKERVSIPNDIVKILEKALQEEFENGWGGIAEYRRHLTLDEAKELLEEDTDYIIYYLGLDKKIINEDEAYEIEDIENYPYRYITEEMVAQYAQDCTLECDTEPESLLQFIQENKEDQAKILAYYNKTKNIKHTAIAIFFKDYKSKLTNADCRVICDCWDALGLIDEKIKSDWNKIRESKSALNRAKEDYAKKICKRADSYNIFNKEEGYYSDDKYFYL